MPILTSYLERDVYANPLKLQIEELQEQETPLLIRLAPVP